MKKKPFILQKNKMNKIIKKEIKKKITNLEKYKRYKKENIFEPKYNPFMPSIIFIAFIKSSRHNTVKKTPKNPVVILKFKLLNLISL